MFQSLLYQFKLRSKMIIPFDIKQEYKFLNNTQQQCTLHSKQQLNQSTYLMRFGNSLTFHNKINIQVLVLDSIFDQMILSLISIQLDIIVPFQQLIIDPCHLCRKQELFQHILNINGPFTNYLYHGQGLIEVPKYNINQNYQYIGIVAESSAIAAFFQLIEGIATNGDNTHIGLLYVTDTLDELILMEELILYMEEKKVNATFLLRNEQNPIGQWSQGLYLPQPNDQTFILVCGSRAFKKETKQQLEYINHQNIAII